MCSLGLFSLVVLNAQLGCDSPTSSPEAQDAKPAPAGEPQPAPAGEPQPDAKAPTASPTSSPQPAPHERRDSPATPAPEQPSPSNPEAKPAPVLMPASKSGGDFGSMRFPGEKQDQAAQAQQQNPAPNAR